MLKLFDLSKLYVNTNVSYDSEKYNRDTFGMLWSKETRSDVLEVYTKHRSVVQVPPDTYDESAIEMMCHLSILSDIKDEKITFVELGAGCGNQSIRVWGAIKNQVVPMNVKDASFVGVEAEPFHFKQLCETYRINEMDGFPIFGAVTDRNGKITFYIQEPDTGGQGIYDGCGKAVVQCFSFDTIVDLFKIGKVHYIDMDIQREELKVVQSSQHILNGEIDYIKIGTHCVEFSQQLKDTLSEHYDCILDIPYAQAPDHECGIAYVKELGCSVRNHDGLMVFKNKCIQ